MFIFYTELLRREIYDRHGRWVGRPHDFTCALEGHYPPLTSLVLTTGGARPRYARFPMTQLHHTTVQGEIAFQLRTNEEQMEWLAAPPATHELSLRHNILDQQVVDVYNRKVVRVNDIHMLQVNEEFRIAHVDVGVRGMVRRLRFERLIDRVVRLFASHARYLTHESFIAWKFVQPLQINQAAGTIPITVAQADIKAIPPADLSEMLIELDPYQRVALFKSLDAFVQGEILGELEPRFRRELVSELDPKTAVAVLERMPPDEATDVLQTIPRRTADRILSEMGAARAQQLTELSLHPTDTAGGLMTTEYVALTPEQTVAEAIEHIKRQQGRAETIYYTYVIESDGTLAGVVSFRTLLIEPMEKIMRDIMDARPIAVRIDASSKEVAFMLSKYSFLAIPVIDDSRVLHGIITFDDILALAIDSAWGEKSGMM